MNGKESVLALAVITALLAVITALGAAPAFAGRDDIDTRGERGGSVVPCSLSGVNPAIHPEIFGNPAIAAREYGFVKSRDGTWHVEPNCHR
jgi:hypothetical protein